MNDNALDSMKADETLLRRELEACNVQFRGNVRQFKCPFHDDNTPSASIHQHEGRWFVKCFGCGFSGTFIDVRARRNQRTVAEELRAMNDSNDNRPIRAEPPPTIYPTPEACAAKFSKHEATYIYANPDTGKVDAVVVRFWNDSKGKKEFSQFRSTPGGFINKGVEKPWPLYNRGRVKTAARVVLVEGEKCVHALHDVGIVATTAIGGGNPGNANKIDLTPLAGKEVFIWPDNDHPTKDFPMGKGIQFMREMRRELEQLSPRPRLHWIDPTALELGDGGDVADVVERYHGWTKEEIATAIQDIIEDAKPLGVSGKMDEHYSAIARGEMRSLPFGPWTQLTQLTNALLPGTVTMICGDPGSTKSFLLLEAAAAWQEFNVRWCIYELEEDCEFHMKRATAQYCGNHNFTNHDWVEKNAEIANKLRNRQWEDEFGSHITDAPDEDIDLNGLADWIDGRAKAGYQVICADPITAVDNSREPWVAERKFLLRVKRIARQHKTRLVLVTHPTKDTKRGFAMGGMAGSTNYQRFTQTVLWLERCQDEEVRVDSGRSSASQYLACNRKVHLIKTRNSVGAGLSLAFWFDRHTFRFTELGVILPEAV